METGSKAFRAEFLRAIKLHEDRFGFEVEVTARASALKCRIYEVAIDYHGRTYSEGKKIAWTDGVRALWCIIKYNVLCRNASPCHELRPEGRNIRPKAYFTGKSSINSK
jgi:hypothetical protein